MKKCFLILLTVCAVQTSYSQTEKGKMFIGGQVTLSGNTTSNSDTSYKSDNNSIGFTVAPNFGYFIMDNFAIGANVNLGVSNSTQKQDYPNQTPSEYTYKYNTLSFGIGGFARYYINITDNFKFYFNGGINYLHQTKKTTYSNNDPNYVYSTSNPANQVTPINNISLFISPGVVYFVTPKIGIQAAFGNINYSYSSSKNTSLTYANHSNSSSFGVNLNLSAFALGLNYYF
jgi:hypothetical protein